MYSGLPLPQEDEDYAYQNKLKLVVRALLSHLGLAMLNISSIRTYSGAPSSEQCFFPSAPLARKRVS